MEAYFSFGGRHELGQNHLIHRPTIHTIIDLVQATDGGILEIGAGGGALTLPLARLQRDLLAVDLDPRSVERLRRRLHPGVPGVVVEHADALSVPFDRDVIVGNIPYHLTTPILRRLLGSAQWQDAVLLTQWEVARKRAGVGGGTMLTAQSAPWFQFALRGRVPASGFRPQPGVDGGVLTVRRRPVPLLDPVDRTRYERFVKQIFTGPGTGLGAILAGVLGERRRARSLLMSAGVPPGCLPRDLTPVQWARLWQDVRSRDLSHSGRRVAE